MYEFVLVYDTVTLNVVEGGGVNLWEKIKGRKSVAHPYNAKRWGTDILPTTYSHASTLFVEQVFNEKHFNC